MDPDGNDHPVEAMLVNYPLENDTANTPSQHSASRGFELTNLAYIIPLIPLGLLFYMRPLK